MYEFVKNMFVMGRIDAEGVKAFVLKGFITEDEAKQIMKNDSD